ncbi:myelin-oligodendrocyte glycoprotein [Maylandia zebra]|uniref:myelin-oligodendrocyte glycoprotein n=1 Tax=Maylandia zebra TaxID=106582 RepID=UPI00403C3956
MRAGRSACLCWSLLSVCVLLVSADRKIITADSGQTATLPCRGPNSDIIGVEWSRADLKTQYVLLYRDEQLDPTNQHPNFKDRVDLQDRQMTDGDVSLILKDVKTEDTGTYECRLLDGKSISSIYLRVVDPPGQTGGHTEDGGKEDGFVGLRAGLPLPVMFIIAGVFLIYRKHKKRRRHGLYYHV